MSHNKTLFSFFIKNNYNKKISTQQLYSVYILLHKHNTTLTFNQFYLYMYLFTGFFKRTDKIYLFLGYLFFFKTAPIKLIKAIKSSGDINIVSNTTVNNFNYVFSDFWRKFKKLKRPATDLSHSDHFISSYKSKITKYSVAGFIVLFDSFYVIRSKSELFLKTLVQINKPLLITPKYSSSSINKYLAIDSLQNFEFQFLRKNKVYNKGRYSRCRQNYRTGVYMCMYLSVVSIFGLYYWFYKFSFNFTYLWWLFISFVASFFLPKIIKYRLYEPTTLFSKFFSLFKWVFLLIKSFLR